MQLKYLKITLKITQNNIFFHILILFFGGIKFLNLLYIINQSNQNQIKMAHEIYHDKIKGTHSFVNSRGENAWHGLGQKVEGTLTSAEAIELANLDYEVKKTEIYAGIENLDYSKIEDKFATYRADTNQVLGIVGSRYEIVQNKDAFGFFDAIIDSGEAIFETAGVLNEGRRIFVTAKLPEDLLVGGEPCNKYIILTNSHDGTSSIIAGFTVVRVVCNNTLQAALKGLSNKVTIEHRSGAKEKLNEAYKVMNISSKYMQEVGDIFNQMTKVNINDDQLKSYITQVMMPENKFLLSEEEKEKQSTTFKNKVNSIYEFALSHPTQLTEASRGTLWGAYNSISGYFNYDKNYENQEKKFVSHMFGNANTKIVKGFTKALELI